MLVEFVGLPGAGKTSLAARTEEMLRDSGHRVGRLRQLSRSAMDAAVKSLKFIRNRPERLALFGCLEYRRENPEVFDLLFATHDRNPAGALWSMDLLSQLYFADAQIKQGAIALCDEGLLHRGVASFVGRGDLDGFTRFNEALPSDFLAVHVKVSVELAIERVLSRATQRVRRRHSDRELAEFMDEQHELTCAAIEIRRKRGLPVVELDAIDSIEANSRTLMDGVVALLPVVGEIDQPLASKA